MAIKKPMVDYNSVESFIDGLYEINKASSLVAEYETRVADETRILSLLKADRVRVIRKWVEYDALTIMLDTAKKWYFMFNDEENKIDRRKKYPEKDGYDYFVKELSETFFNNEPIEIVGFMQGGFEGYYEAVEIKYKNIVYNLQIPIVSRASDKNLELTDFCKLALYKRKSEHCLTRIAASYNEEDIAKAIQEENDD